jgi:hypothetical protein
MEFNPLSWYLGSLFKEHRNDNSRYHAFTV